MGDFVILTSIAPLAATADAWISDIWGVLHNGRTAFPTAGEACVRFRERCGSVVLVTNAPYSAGEIVRMLDRLGVPSGAYDAIVSSGEVTRELIRPWTGRPIFHLGPDRYLSVFDGLAPRFAGAADADVVVCSGLLHDDTETPADYDALLAQLRRRDLELICLNPDIVVERGDRIVYCAGALAEAYETIGGRVAYAGKPHLPIYDKARRIIDELRGGRVGADRILAIGDSVRTDMRGAARAGVRSVFIASALHVGHGHALDAATLGALFAEEPARPVAAMQALAW